MYLEFPEIAKFPTLIILDDSIQGDMNGWMNFNDPLDNTHTFNASGLVSSIQFEFACVNLPLTYANVGGHDETEEWIHLGWISGAT